MRTARVLLPLFLLSTCAFAQSGTTPTTWELGGAFGWGFYHNGSVYAPAGKVVAGVRNRFTAGVTITEDRFEHFSGEFRYLYHDGDPFLSSGAVKTNVQGQSHTFVYDVLFQAAPRDSKVRPYVATGVGGKYFEVSGPANASAPFGNIATLTTNSNWRVVVSLGGGVSVRLQPHLALRLDFRDYLTPFPKKMIVAAPGGTTRGILNQFTPLVGLSYVF
jgi:opacity protein-like surface antigen